MRSYARLHTSHPQDPPYLLICGSGPCLHELQDLARTLHVETFTEFRAFQNDVSGFFADIDMLVQPSLNESWGLTVLEAMSQRKAVITTTETGLHEILTGEECLFFDPSDEDELYKCLEALQEEGLRNRLSSNGYDKVRLLNLNHQFELTIKDIL